MKVLLTGASGFVGSHILDNLRARGIPTAAILRTTSDPRFIEHSLPFVEIHRGSFLDRQDLLRACADVTHVIHCAGCTKALRNAEFYEINQGGTRQVVEAVNSLGSQVERLIHVSSQAAVGPSMPGGAVREDTSPNPVSEYGRSKLAAEEEVRRNCRAGFIILRPPAVYGPRDAEFLRLFRAVKSHLRPIIGDGRGALSLVFVEDLAAAAVECLEVPVKANKTFFVASPEVIQSSQIANEIAAIMKRWTIPLPLPSGLFWAVCAAQEALSRLTGKPSVLSRQKYPELRAPNWVCDPALLQRETGFVCGTTLKRGITLTLDWYQKQGWL